MRTLLDTLYQALPPATDLPQGTYDGVSWPLNGRWAGWRGKVFTMRGWRGVVVNRIGPWQFIEGNVSLPAGAGEVQIYYPQLQLTDYLKPVGPGAWLGWTQPLKRGRIWFLLTLAK